MNWADFCYTGLIFMSVSALFYTIIRTKDKFLIPLFFLTVGMIFFGEYLVLFVFEGYIYKVDYFKEFYYNNYTGHIISNALSLPATAVLVAGFSLKFRHILGITLFFVGVEWLFLKLDIYEHRWWNLSFTAIALISLFVIVKKWYGYIKAPASPLLMGFGYVCILFSLHILLREFPLGVVLNKIKYSPGWFENPLRDSGVFYPLVGVTKSFIDTFFLRYVNNRYLAVVLMVSTSVLLDILLKSLNLMIFEGIGILGLIIIEVLIICVFVLIEEFILVKKLSKL
jgi:hypothetical protein